MAIVGDGTQSVAGHFAPIGTIALEGDAILRWSDGRVAATEQPLAAGCLRTVAIDVPETGDEVLRPGFARLVRTLAMPCGGGSAATLPDSVVARWASGQQRSGNARRSEYRDGSDVRSVIGWCRGARLARADSRAPPGRGAPAPARVVDAPHA